MRAPRPRAEDGGVLAHGRADDDVGNGGKAGQQAAQELRGDLPGRQGMSQGARPPLE
ncbi:MAG: hypothetical protein IRY99_09450 [Isosphaeraceae bacterium]|nr:hypothetical protein [Isosphaeraceae bacterium]